MQSIGQTQTLSVWRQVDSIKQPRELRAWDQLVSGERAMCRLGQLGQREFDTAGARRIKLLRVASSMVDGPDARMAIGVHSQFAILAAFSMEVASSRRMVGGPYYRCCRWRDCCCHYFRHRHEHLDTAMKELASRKWLSRHSLVSGPTTVLNCRIVFSPCLSLTGSLFA